jgi:hypothetical protein
MVLLKFLWSTFNNAESVTTKNLKEPKQYTENFGEV